MATSVRGSLAGSSSFIEAYDLEDAALYTSIAFVSLTSYPGFGELRSCLAVEVLPSVPNLAPVFQQPTLLTKCAADCCDCCGQTLCGCQKSVDSSDVVCCTPLYAVAGEIFHLPVRAVDTESSEKVILIMRGLRPGVKMPAGVSFPEMLALKYGCGEKDYFECNSDMSITNDVQTVLRWDLKTMGLYTCLPKGATLAIKCNGLSDVTTCGTLGTPCEAPQRISVSPFKICYNACEELRPGVDVAAQRWAEA